MKTAKWEDKVWGRVMHVFSFCNAAVSYLEVKKGYECSIHYHKKRVNHFAVIKGKIRIEEWLSEDLLGKADCITELNEGDTYSVPICVKHRFQVLESGIVVEYYGPHHPSYDVSLDDIVRQDEGGKMEGF